MHCTKNSFVSNISFWVDYIFSECLQADCAILSNYFSLFIGEHCDHYYNDRYSFMVVLWGSEFLLNGIICNPVKSEIWMHTVKLLLIGQRKMQVHSTILIHNPFPFFELEQSIIQLLLSLELNHKNEGCFVLITIPVINFSQNGP